MSGYYHPNGERAITLFLPRFPSSPARGERDDFDPGAGLNGGGGVVAGEDRLFVEFGDDGLAGEAEGYNQLLQRARAFEGPGRAVDGDDGRRVHFHCSSCSGNGQSWQSVKSSRQKS